MCAGRWLNRSCSMVFLQHLSLGAAATPRWISSEVLTDNLEDSAFLSFSGFKSSGAIASGLAASFKFASYGAARVLGKGAEI